MKQIFFVLFTSFLLLGCMPANTQQSIPSSTSKGERKKMINFEDLKKDNIQFDFREVVSPEVYKEYPYDISYSVVKKSERLFETTVKFGRRMNPSDGDNMDIPGYVMSCAHAAIAKAHGYPYWVSGGKKSDSDKNLKDMTQVTAYFALLSSNSVPSGLGGDDIDFSEEAMPATTDLPACQKLFSVKQ